MINNAYDPNIKMSFVNYIIFNNNAGNDASEKIFDSGDFYGKKQEGPPAEEKK